MARRANPSVIPNPLTEATRALKAVNLAIGRHVTGCYRCAHAGLDAAKGCDDGWELAKRQARAQAAVRRAVDRAAGLPGQGTLW